MEKTPVIAIFDLGKTNKKVFLFDPGYRIVWEKSTVLDETTDEDGDPCEDVHALTDWLDRTFREILTLPGFEIRAVNVAAYGASLVYLDETGKVIAPLYNYLKPYPQTLQAGFYKKYGGEPAFARRSASPVLGSLNSGMQLYRLCHEQPALFARIRHALHLPQYAAALFSGQYFSEITSLGCHTNLWDFDKNKYGEWVEKEGLAAKFPPLAPALAALTKTPDTQREIVAGTGLHDSSAALIPYLASFEEPFILLSTGTWCITLNPFNAAPLTDGELRQDCLCYLSHEGKPVKAARFFGGYEYEQAVRELAERFGQTPDFFKNGAFDPPSPVESEAEAAYHRFMVGFVARQAASTRLVLSPGVQRIFVDGGFAGNALYLHLLAAEFPDCAVFAASVAQATALGAALALHEYWNTRPLADNLIELKRYFPPTLSG